MPGEPEVPGEVPMPSAARQVGSRAAPTERDNPESELNVPPGIKLVFGYPSNANPFIQAKLPLNMAAFENKRSRAMSYRNPNAPDVLGGTTRSFDMAKQAIESWAWQWFEGLSTAEQEALKAKVDQPPLKKQRT